LLSLTSNKMKKVVGFIVVIFLLSSCSFETFRCHSYGHTNHKTKSGNKAQAGYHKTAKRSI